MAEDLTEFMHEAGLRVRYMHSDVETLERIELIRDLRLGVYDVLVGINLLREGLDIPEVSCVAILDADKEGFLRSERSLIQTIGRAARNLNGKAILYADRITGSMERAMAESEKRRRVQLDFNKAHNIVPAGVSKKITDIMEGAYSEAGESRNRKRAPGSTGSKVGSENHGDMHSDIKAIGREIARLESQMYELARNLDFEAAAAARDEVARLKKRLLELDS